MAAADPLVNVSLEGDSRSYKVPQSMVASGQAKAWIEEQQAQESDRKARLAESADRQLAKEFGEIRKSMGELTSLRGQVQNLSDALSASEANAKAQGELISTLQAGVNDFGGSGQDVRSLTAELSTASVTASGLLRELKRVVDEALAIVESSSKTLQGMVDDYAKEVEAHKAAHKASQQLLQEAQARFFKQVAETESAVNEAKVMAQEALTLAAEAKRANTSAVSIQSAADEASRQTMRDWETSSDTSTIRKLLGTDVRSLDHLAMALEQVSSEEIGGVGVEKAAEVARGLVQRIVEAQGFRDGFGVAAADKPDTSDGSGKAAPPRNKKRGGKR